MSSCNCGGIGLTERILYGCESCIAGVIEEAGGNVDVRDRKGQTALHIAAKQNMQKSVITLVEHGADVNAEDNSGNTPLYLACNNLFFVTFTTQIENGIEMKIIDYLINNGADLHHEHSRHGVTVIQVLKNILSEVSENYPDGTEEWCNGLVHLIEKLENMSFPAEADKDPGCS